MSWTLSGASRAAHLKILALSIAAATVVVLVGLNARTSDNEREASSGAVKAGAQGIYASQRTSTIR